MGQHDETAMALAIAADVLGGEALMHLAAPMPRDDLDLCPGRDVFCQILVRDHDDAVGAQRLDDIDGIRRGAADVGFGLHLRGGIDVGDDRYTRVMLPHQTHIRARDRGRERATGLEVGDEHRLVWREELGRLRHEVYAALDDDPGTRARGCLGQLQRVAAEVGNGVEDLRRHVVMRQDDGVLFAFEAIDVVHVGREATPIRSRE